MLSTHRGVDLNLFDDIINLIEYWATDRRLDFRSAKYYRRASLINLLSKMYNLNALKPKINTVQIFEDTTVDVPTFDVKTILLLMLHDPNIMTVDNIAPDYDVFTGTRTTPTTHLDEIVTGSAWAPACNHYRGGDPNVLPLPLVAFYDKTHTDLFGALSVSPFIATFAFLNKKCRNRSKSYEVFGYIPNITFGNGKSCTTKSVDKLQAEHDCLRLITEQLNVIHRSGGFWTTVFGKKVRVVPWLHLIAGDTSGHNNLVGHYNGGNASVPYRDCKCLMNAIDKPIAECELLTVKELDSMQERGLLHEVCKHDINNAFRDVPLGDLIHGLCGCTPAEALHVFGNGIMKCQLESVHDLIGENETHKALKNNLDELHQQLVCDTIRNGEKDLLRMSTRNGITDGTKMTASERIGNVFILLCATFTKDGIDMFSAGLSEGGLTVRQFQDCLKLELGFMKWINNSNDISTLPGATVLLGTLIESIKTCFPRRQAKNGWKIPKMHSLAKMIHYMAKFGKAQNFSGQTGERALKEFVKDHAQQTQRHVNVFARQCAMREFETKVLAACLCIR